MARSFRRDRKGRFARGSGGGSARKKKVAKKLSRSKFGKSAVRRSRAYKPGRVGKAIQRRNNNATKRKRSRTPAQQRKRQRNVRRGVKVGIVAVGVVGLAAKSRGNRSVAVNKPIKNGTPAHLKSTSRKAPSAGRARATLGTPARKSYPGTAFETKGRKSSQDLFSASYSDIWGPGSKGKTFRI